MIRRWPRPAFYVVLALVVALDQAVKAWATASLDPFNPVRVIPGFFDLAYNTNTGVAFSLGEHHGGLISFFMIVLAGLALWFARGLDWRPREPNIVGGCLCGGALGNMIDRARLGHVVDFLDVYVGPHHWPTFNVADSFICLSVAWIVVRQLELGKKVKGKR
jgi:signal peptidase II